jgi:hypothetical protein
MSIWIYSIYLDRFEISASHEYIQRDKCTVGLTKGVMGGCQLRSLAVWRTLLKRLVENKVEWKL